MPKMTAAKKTRTMNLEAEGAPAGSREQYDHWLSQAQQISAADVRPMRADVALAVTNAARGADAVLEESKRIEKELPGVSLALVRNLHGLGSALQFAVGQVDVWAPPPKDLKQKLSRATQLRAVLLASSDALAKAGVLNAAVVAKIHQGHGSIDIASDCVALAELFTKNAAATKGKVPFTAAEVREASALGTALLQVLRPKGARKQPTAKELATAVDARDRLWTLFETTWEDNVWRAGTWIWKREYERHVPPLQSRVVGKRPKKAAATAAPAKANDGSAA